MFWSGVIFGMFAVVALILIAYAIGNGLTEKERKRKLERDREENRIRSLVQSMIDENCHGRKSNSESNVSNQCDIGYHYRCTDRKCYCACHNYKVRQFLERKSRDPKTIT